ncbi:MAG: enoyl-CoA hydratase-related protein [Spirochaetaceae bacterium]|nr:enoyl-CoA hydratase-related protein [Spirochaetaceae bacterium]MDT8298056.1 enoyl-CoA hydratase-related protein [Spirochaetaceae bacterium]
MSSILVSQEEHIATITLNRPEKLNALTKDMWGRLGDVIEDLSEQRQLRCIVIKGAGKKAFSPGNDIREFETERADSQQAEAYGRLMHRVLSGLRACPVPTLAVIQGICVGGGLEIAACCDIRICGESSRFGIPINRLGLVMAYQEIAALKALVGDAVALEILLEGRVFDAREAKEKKLVNRIVADSEVVSEGEQTAKRIADGAPLVARRHKKFLKRLDDPEPLSAEELSEGFACFDSRDFEIGYKAFLAKEKPQFEGH